MPAGEEKAERLTGIPASGNSLGKARVRSGWSRNSVVRKEATEGAWGHTVKGSYK